MGSCVGKASHDNRFEVWNINDEHVQVHKGVMKVTASDLIYTDSHTTDEWKWPLKYLRRYGCESKIFTFEVCHKCTTGEGHFAFTSEEADELFKSVACNIENLAREQSPFATDLDEHPLYYFPSKREQAAVSSPPPTTTVPNPAEKIDHTHIQL